MCLQEMQAQARNAKTGKPLSQTVRQCIATEKEIKMDKSKQILKIARDRLGNQPTYNPVEFLEMCAVVRDEIEAAEQSVQADGACAECNGRNGYHKTGCKNWLWEPSPSR